MSKYMQEEFCLDLNQGDNDSPPVWMKVLPDRPKPPSFRSLQIQLLLFDISPYAPAKNFAPTNKATDRCEQAAIPSSQHL